MPTLDEVIAYQSSVGDVSTLAMADLLDLWNSLTGGDPGAVAGDVRGVLPDLIDAYVPLSAEVGASFYDDARAAAGSPGAYLARPADPPAAGQVQELISWGVAPLFRVDSPDPDLALSRLTGGVQKIVAAGARDTVEFNVGEDPAQPRFARHASANACAFCALLATRGAVYRWEDTAGAKYHDHCHCVAVPVFPGTAYEPAPYVKGWEDAYKSARADVGGKTKDILAHMRLSLGAK
jgi:hypothetical protein